MFIFFSLTKWTELQKESILTMEVYWVKPPHKGNKETWSLVVLVLGKSSSLVCLLEDSTQRTEGNGYVISAAPPGSYFGPFPPPLPPSLSSSTSTCSPPLLHLPVLWIKVLNWEDPSLAVQFTVPTIISLYPPLWPIFERWCLLWR